ncbi:hypothetical protein DXG03_000871 [Asterophora parasitica]|uniref:Uncharacterized protein n=1 Tax=Asterophora parasitica TaxID=117018 RepID=A0A9P7KAL0_9AGAR|nr:hypothetical protein DXG03_000871 [Asterophora parasitica]
MGSIFSLVAGLGFMGALFSIASQALPDRAPLIHFSPKPALVNVKKGKDTDETQQTSLRELVETRCQSLFTEFKPLWWLFKYVKDLPCIVRETYAASIAATSKPSTVSLVTSPKTIMYRITDFTPTEDSNLKEDTPIVVVKHGLTGGARLFIFTCGFSLTSIPQAHTSPILLKSFVGKHIYSKGMGGNLQNLLKRHVKSFEVVPGHMVSEALALTMALKNPTLDQFDDTFTRVAGGSPPTFPFRTAEDYYQWGSSHHVVKDIRVPFLAINAADDPVVRHVPMDGGGNGYVVMELTSSGGHLGWFQTGDGFIDRWTTKPVLEWLKLNAEDIVLDTNRPTRRLFVDDDGYLREDGTPHLGCKEIDGGGVIDQSGGAEGILQGL